MVRARSRCYHAVRPRKSADFLLLLLLVAPLLLQGRLAAASAVDGASAGQAFELKASPFEEPLVRTVPTTLKEDHELARAIAAYSRQGAVDDFRGFGQLLAQHRDRDGASRY